MQSPSRPRSAMIASAAHVVWGSAASVDGGKAKVRIDRVLSGGDLGSEVVVDLSDFADRKLRSRSVFVLDDAVPPRVLVDPTNEVLTPLRIERVLAGGVLADDPLGAAVIREAAAGADGAFEAVLDADDDGTSARVIDVTEVFEGEAPEVGDRLVLPAGADWDIGAGRLRRHVVAVRSGADSWTLSIRPFGPGDDMELGWATVNADPWHE